MTKHDNEPGGENSRSSFPFEIEEPVPPQVPTAGKPAPVRFKVPVPYVTYGILGICIAVFVVYNGVLGRQALNSLCFGPAHGQVWPQLITSMFAHEDEWHLLGNMCGVFFLGRIIEWRYGSWRYAALYFASGIFADLAFAATDPMALSLGASGALSGVMAAFLRHYPKSTLYLYGVLPIPTWILIPGWILLNILGATVGSSIRIAFMAHIAGFAAGMILSLVFLRPGSKDSDRGSTWFTLK